MPNLKKKHNVGRAKFTLGQQMCNSYKKAFLPETGGYKRPLNLCEERSEPGNVDQIRLSKILYTRQTSV